MIQAEHNDRERLFRELDTIWQEDAAVQQFGLELLREKVKPMYGGWVVPVASGVQGGDAYDLIRALDRIQERAEKSTELSISVVIDPGFSD